MAELLDLKAERSEGDDEEEEMDVTDDARSVHGRRKIRPVQDESEDDDEEEGDDSEDEELVNDLIDDNPIEEDESGDEDDGSDEDGSGKRNKSDDDEELPDVLDDDDYDLIEENMGVKVQRKKYKRLRRMEEEESDEEGTQDGRGAREAIANQLFEGSDNEEEGEDRSTIREEATGHYSSEESEGDYSETDDFIVDDDGRPLKGGRGGSSKKRRSTFTDAKLQEAQDIFGVDFDYDTFEKYDAEVGDDDDDDEEKDVHDGTEERPRLKGKSIQEIYEPHELERAGFTEEDTKLRTVDIPEWMQLRNVPVTCANEEELEEEAEWIYKKVFSKRFVNSDPVPRPARTTLTNAGQSEANWDEDWETQTVVPGPAQTTVGEEDWGNPGQFLVPNSVDVPIPRPAPTQVEEEDWDDEENWKRKKTSGTNEEEAVMSEDKPAETTQGHAEDAFRKKMTSKIKKVLDFLRNKHFEVPFIAFYRKEHFHPDLNMKDLWTIYRWDARFCQLKTRKGRLLELFINMMNYQASEMPSPRESSSESIMRPITEEDLDRVNAIESADELKDIYMFFNLYYADEVPAMKEGLLRKEKEERQQATEKGTGEEGDEQTTPECDPPDGDLLENEDEVKVKPKVGGGPYGMCRKLGVHTFLKQFGLSSQQFAENLRDNYKRHEVEQCETDPLETAKEHCSVRLKTPEAVLSASKFMLATQISREPIVRQCVREVFFQNATISCSPTKTGLKTIDEAHPCFGMKYLKDKRVKDLKDDQFLKLVLAEEDLLLTISLGENIVGKTEDYIEESKELFKKDEFRKTVQDWNALRGECVQFAFEKLLYPQLRRELRAKLLEDAKEHIVTTCSNKLWNYLKIAPFQVSFPNEDEEEWSTRKGLRILAIAYDTDYEETSYACLISPEGEPSEYLRLKNTIRGSRAQVKIGEPKAPQTEGQENDQANSDKMQNDLPDLLAIKSFIQSRKPHLIVVAGESMDAITIQKGIQAVIDELVQEDEFPAIDVEIVDNSLAKVYANSIKSSMDFREYPLLLKEAVSLGRRMQDPLVEFSQLCNADEEILNLRFHPLQDYVPKEELLDTLHLQFVSRTNEVGVDLNRAVAHPNTASLVQFVCGLGPRKANTLLKILKLNNQRLENRTQLITTFHMGPNVFINCSGFIKIDTDSLGDSAESFVDVLDGSRVHPETYEWAKRMAIDAMDMEYNTSDGKQATALEEVVENPDVLKDLDLDAFADELQRTGFGDKGSTLYKIKEELTHRYKDLRFPYEKPTPEELFSMLTKETPETFFIGKLVTASVLGIAMQRPSSKTEPLTIEKRGEYGQIVNLFKCSYCERDDFENDEMYRAHLDDRKCPHPGTPSGVRIRLQNGIYGFIYNDKLSDSPVQDPSVRVQRGQAMHCRILRIEIERFLVYCTSRTSDLRDVDGEFRRNMDEYYDREKEDAERAKEVEIQKKNQRHIYTKRAIAHPSFKNVCYGEAEKLMEAMDQGEVVIRPSSKGADHLTVTWKVANGISQHIDVVEKVKEKNTMPTFHIGDAEFEDFDEIIATHVNPMASNAQEIMNYRYYVGYLGGSHYKAEEYLSEERSKNPGKIHYILQASKDCPGKFLLSYLPRTRGIHEFVTVTPDGFRFRQQSFDSLERVLKWFKENYQKPPPTSIPRTPTNFGGSSTPRTPSGHDDTDSRGGGAELVTLTMTARSTPYTPSAPTPFITPTHQMQTPQDVGFRFPSGHPHASSSNQFVHPQHLRSSQNSPIKFPISSDNDARKAVEAYARSYQQKAAQQSWPSSRNSGGNPFRASGVVAMHGDSSSRSPWSHGTPRQNQQRSSATGIIPATENWEEEDWDKSPTPGSGVAPATPKPVSSAVAPPNEENWDDWD